MNVEVVVLGLLCKFKIVTFSLVLAIVNFICGGVAQLVRAAES